MRNLLGRYGLSENDLAQLVKDYLCFNKLEELIGSGIQAVPSEVDKSYIQRNRRYTASIVNFDRSDYEKDAEITDEEINKYFEERNKPAEPAATQEIVQIPNAEHAPDAPVEAATPPAPQFAPIMTAPKRGFQYMKFTPEKLAEDATNEDKSKAEIGFAKQVNRIYSALAAEGADFDKVASEFAAKDHSFEVVHSTFEPFKSANRKP